MPNGINKSPIQVGEQRLASTAGRSAKDQLIVELIENVRLADSVHHSMEGVGDYKMDPEIREFIQRARALGIDVEEAA